MHNTVLKYHILLCWVIRSTHATVFGWAGGKVGGSIDMLVGGRVEWGIGRNAGGSVGGKLCRRNGWKVVERVDGILSGKAVDSDRVE